MKVTVTFGHLNPKPGFVSAWDAAKTAYDATHGAGGFDALPRIDRNGQNQQIDAVRAYVNREVQSC
jgi:hypothetical protein